LAVHREADDIECDKRTPPHGENVAQGVGSGYLSESEWVVHNGGDEIQGENPRPRVVHHPDCRVLPVGPAGKKEALLLAGKVFKYFLKVRRTYLGRSAAAVRKLRQPHGDTSFLRNR
jgi:hypothetical protein